MPRRYYTGMRTRPSRGKKHGGLFQIEVSGKGRKVSSVDGSVGDMFEEIMTDTMRNKFAGTAREIYRAFRRATPVDTGFARDSWKIKKARRKDTYRIENDAPYIKYLENGHSQKQAPFGITIPATQELRARKVIQ